MFDTYAFAAPLVAAVTGIPAVHHSIGPLPEPSVLDLVADAVSPIWREFGIDVPRAAGVFSGTTLTVCPSSLDPAAVGLRGAQLPHCTAVVHHAGAGTMFRILAHGLPSVTLPRSADNFTIASRLSTAGFALTLMPPEVAAAAVRRGLRAVLDTAGYRQKAPARRRDPRDAVAG